MVSAGSDRGCVPFFLVCFRVGDYADVDNWPALEKTLLIHNISLSALYYTVYPNNKMRSCILIGLVCHTGGGGPEGLMDRDVEEV